MSVSVGSQLQWSVDHTAGRLMSNIKGLLQAATSDSIQPAALLACEQLGTELPLMSVETRIKFEELARRKQASHSNS